MDEAIQWFRAFLDTEWTAKTAYHLEDDLDTFLAARRAYEALKHKEAGEHLNRWDPPDDSMKKSFESKGNRQLFAARPVHGGRRRRLGLLHLGPHGAAHRSRHGRPVRRAACRRRFSPTIAVRRLFSTVARPGATKAIPARSAEARASCTSKASTWAPYPQRARLASSKRRPTPCLRPPTKRSDLTSGPPARSGYDDEQGFRRGFCFKELNQWMKLFSGFARSSTTEWTAKTAYHLEDDLGTFLAAKSAYEALKHEDAGEYLNRWDPPDDDDKKEYESEAKRVLFAVRPVTADGEGAWAFYTSNHMDLDVGRAMHVLFVVQRVGDDFRLQSQYKSCSTCNATGSVGGGALRGLPRRGLRVPQRHRLGPPLPSG